MAYAIPYIVMAAATLYSAQQQKQAQEYEAAVDDANAKLARNQTAAAEEGQRRQMAHELGRMRASAIDSGFDPGSGTLLNLQSKSAGEMELDILTNRYRGELEAIGLERDAGTRRYNAKVTERQGYLNAASTLAGGYSDYSRQTRINQTRGQG